MSDFMMRLAARSLHLGNDLHPRLAGHFEPVSPGKDSGIRAGGWLAAEESHQEQISPGPIERPVPRGETAARLVFFGSRRPGWLSSENSGSTEQNAPRQAAHPRSEVSITPSRRDEPLNPAEPRDAVEETGPRSLAQRSRPLSPEAGNPAGISTDLSDRARRADPPDPSQGAPGLIRPIVTPRSEPETRPANPTRRSAQAETRPERLAEPEIRINIGRIEVRAVSGNLPQRPSPTPGSLHLTLEDYLKSRSGGGS